MLIGLFPFILPHGENMTDIIHYKHCPICHSANLRDIFKVKDHAASGESFLIVECEDCTLRFTQDIPAASEIGKYYQSEQYISHTNTAEGLVNRIYQLVRKRTLRQKRKLIERISRNENRTLLDIGSGTGAFADEMQKNGWQVTGLEPDAKARKNAMDLFDVKLEDAGKLFEFPSQNFSVITLWHVLEHVHDLSGYMYQLKRLVAKNGHIVIAVPNYGSTDATAYGQYWAAWDVPRHLYHFSPRSMQALMSKQGLTIRGYKPMWFDSFYVSLLSSKYKNDKANWPAALWTGLRSNLIAMTNVKKCSSIIYIISA